MKLAHLDWGSWKTLNKPFSTITDNGCYRKALFL